MKTKLKLPIVVAIAAMCAALAFALTACATPEKLAKKLAEKDSTYTVTMTMTHSETNTSYTQDFRFSENQFHAKATMGSKTQYFSLIQEGEKYYKIEGTDEELVKTEISKKVFDETNKSSFGQVKLFKAAIADFDTYFEKSGEIYKLKADQKLAFLKISIPEMTELPDENIEYLDTLELKFENDKITVTMNDSLMTLVFSEIGTTKFEPFTDKVPTVA